MIIGVSSKAGGVGTSLIALTLAHGLASKSKKVLFLSTDINNGVQCFIGKAEFDSNVNLLEAILGDKRRIRVRENLDFLEMFNQFGYINIEDEEQMYSNVSKFLKENKKIYDYIVIDYKYTNPINKLFLKETDKMILISGRGRCVRKGLDEGLREIRLTFEKDGEKNIFDKYRICEKILCVLFNNDYLKKKEVEEEIENLRLTGIYTSNTLVLKKKKFVGGLILKGKTIWESRDKRLEDIKRAFSEILDRTESIKQYYEKNKISI